MYERFYQLRNRPFALSPDPDFLYPSRVHREALDYLRFGIDACAGFIVITGEIGSGKTTLLQVLLRSFDGQTTVIRLVNTLLTGPELLESMLLDLGMDQPPASKPAMLRELARLLIEQRAAGRRVLAVIDEAQNLSPDALEELRMLSNLETEKSKLVQIVLVGQPELRDSLDRPSLEQLRQRVTVRYHIDPLDADETARYINHRLKRAAIAAPLEFPRDVTDLVHARSGGVPRMINVVCDAVLLFGYAEDSRVIDVALVHEAIAELESSNVLRRTAIPPSPSPTEASGKRGSAPPPPTPVSVTSAPAAAPALRDLPLRRPPAAPTSADLPHRAAPDVGRSRETSRPAEHYRLGRTTAPLPSMAHRPETVARVRPAMPAVRGEHAEPGGGWSWLKAMLFGPETGRR
jgi:putative secretion ATPase (PEP-CTERM system associated)